MVSSATDPEQSPSREQQSRGDFRLAWVGKDLAPHACGDPFTELAKAIVAAPEINKKRVASGLRPCKLILQWGPPVLCGPDHLRTTQVVARYLLDGTKVIGSLPEEVVVLGSHELCASAGGQGSAT